jgi:hypothetical protein
VPPEYSITWLSWDITCGLVFLSSAYVPVGSMPAGMKQFGENQPLPQLAVRHRPCGNRTTAVGLRFDSRITPPGRPRRRTRTLRPDQAPKAASLTLGVHHGYAGCVPLVSVWTRPWSAWARCSVSASARAFTRDRAGHG